MLEGRREIVRWVADRLTVVAAAWLAAGLAFSAFVIWAFTELADVVVEGESRAFDRAVLLWIHTTFPSWLDGPMRFVTALGYYWFVVLLLVVVVPLFYQRGWRLSAIRLLLFVSERPRHRRRRVVRDAHARPGLPAAGDGAMGRGRLRNTRCAPDRLFQALPWSALPDRHSGWLPRCPPLARLRRRGVRAVALRPELEDGRVEPSRRVISDPDE